MKFIKKICRWGISFFRWLGYLFSPQPKPVVTGSYAKWRAHMRKECNIEPTEAKENCFYRSN